jgi:hypothetical protein
VTTPVGVRDVVDPVRWMFNNHIARGGTGVTPLRARRATNKGAARRGAKRRYRRGFREA